MDYFVQLVSRPITSQWVKRPEIVNVDLMLFFVILILPLFFLPNKHFWLFSSSFSFLQMFI